MKRIARAPTFLAAVMGAPKRMVGVVIALVLTGLLLLAADHTSTSATSAPVLTVGRAYGVPHMTATEAIAALAKDNAITTLPYATTVTAQYGSFIPVTSPPGEYWAVTISGVRGGEFQTHGNFLAFFHTVTYIVDATTGKVVEDGEGDASPNP